MRKSFLFVLLLSLAFGVAAQKSSIDLAFIRNTHSDMNGLNISFFQHFTQRFTGGIEMNRFFKIKRTAEDEDLEMSAWDFDLNFHYLLPLHKNWTIYPLTGISHTSEKEKILSSGDIAYTRFWSFNTGAGFLFQKGKWAPHAEYNFTWGKINQQFFLAGISYEIEWRHGEKK